MPLLTAPATASYTVTKPSAKLTLVCLLGDSLTFTWRSPGGSAGMRTVRGADNIDLGPFRDTTVFTFTSVSGTPQYFVEDGGVTLVTTAEISSPSAAMLENTLATYQNTAEFLILT